MLIAANGHHPPFPASNASRNRDARSGEGSGSAAAGEEVLPRVARRAVDDVLTYCMFLTFVI
jgi:hypothetical protein